MDKTGKPKVFWHSMRKHAGCLFNGEEYTPSTVGIQVCQMISALFS